MAVIDHEPDSIALATEHESFVSTDALSERIPAASEFQERAEDIISGVKMLKERRKPITEINDELTREYVTEHEDNTQLKVFSDLLISAPAMFHNEKVLNEARVSARFIRAEQRAVITALIGFNHKLRDLVDANPTAFTTDEITSWLEQRGGVAGAAGKLVRGVAAEVAIGREMRYLPEIRDRFHYGSVEDDFKGRDIVVQPPGADEIAVDVKFGEDAEWKGHDMHRRENVRVVALYPEEIENFGVPRLQKEAVQARIRHALDL